MKIRNVGIMVTLLCIGMQVKGHTVYNQSGQSVTARFCTYGNVNSGCIAKVISPQGRFDVSYAVNDVNTFLKSLAFIKPDGNLITIYEEGSSKPIGELYAVPDAYSCDLETCKAGRGNFIFTITSSTPNVVVIKIQNIVPNDINTVGRCSDLQTLDRCRY